VYLANYYYTVVCVQEVSGSVKKKDKSLQALFTLNVTLKDGRDLVVRDSNGMID
jgi:hypothetical protein